MKLNARNQGCVLRLINTLTYFALHRNEIIKKAKRTKQKPHQETFIGLQFAWK